MNATIAQIHKHRSIRKFKKREIEAVKLNAILEAARAASSSGNMQAYSIIVTQDPEMKAKLYKPHFEQSMLMDAPIFLTFCADFHRMRQWLVASNAPMNFDNYMSFMIATLDATLAAQNAALAAESLGLGICYMGTTLASAHEIGEILGCPENVVPVVGFAVGYPDEAPKARDRLPLDGIVHQERYQNYSTDSIREIYRERNRQGMNRYRSVPKLKEKINNARVANLAQVYTQIKYTKASHCQYSQDLLGYLKKKNFLNNDLRN